MTNQERYTGSWWIPESPERIVVGTLTVDVSLETQKQIVLDLHGSLVEGRIHDARKEFPTVLGHTDKGNGLVTLYDCMVVHSQLAIGRPDTVLQSIVAMSCIVGAHINDPHNQPFKAIELEFSNMDQWDGTSPIDSLSLYDAAFQDYDAVFGCRKSSGSMLHLDQRVDLAFQYPVHTAVKRSVSVELKQRTILRLSAQAPLVLSEWMSRYVWPLTDFFTLAHDSSAAIVRIELHQHDQNQPSEDESPDFALHYVLASSIVTQACEQGSWNMLFRRMHIEEDLEGFITRWVNLYREHRATIGRTISVLYRLDTFVDLEFLATLHALLLLSRGQDTEERNSVPARDLGFLSSDVIRHALTGVLERYASVLGQVVPDVETYTDKLLSAASNVLSKAESDPAVFSSRELHWMTGQLEVICKAYLLHLTGFELSTIGKLLQENPSVQFLAAQVRKGAG